MEVARERYDWRRVLGDDSSSNNGLVTFVVNDAMIANPVVLVQTLCSKSQEA